MNFNFGIRSKVIAGPGALKELKGIYEQLDCEKPLIITDTFLGTTDLPDRIKEVVPNAEVFSEVEADPKDKHVFKGIEAVKEKNADMLIAIGGGSSIDIAKMSSVLLTNDVTLEEVLDDWDKITKPGIPLITLPTTVGSGSEMTRGALIGDSRTNTKKVIVSDYLAADYTILDPELLNTLPPAVTASTGADALTQGIEGIISTTSNTFSDALHLHAVSLIKKSLRPAVANSSNLEAMGNMQKASAMVGAAMAHSACGAVHAIANTLGGYYKIPHGIACAMLLLPVLKYNAIAVPDKYRSIAKALDISVNGLQDWEVADRLVATIERLLDDVGITQTLSDFGVEENKIGEIAEQSYYHSDNLTNPRKPSIKDVENLIREAF
ncbi:iron-containing alcohol dehydrogenase family protein [Oceanobacillus sojae]|uniref:iron-containing alcohol dehydrogenase family protein n=1 Tax=Oceanobacillus sojae TaxID=582851 RepID=UPI00158A9F9A|nr:iron-containing alcohol dehydrogenase [Oceanobacillus sojae]